MGILLIVCSSFSIKQNVLLNMYFCPAMGDLCAVKFSEDGEGYSELFLTSTCPHVSVSQRQQDGLLSSGGRSVCGEVQ